MGGDKSTCSTMYLYIVYSSIDTCTWLVKVGILTHTKSKSKKKKKKIQALKCIQCVNDICTPLSSGAIICFYMLLFHPF